MLFNTPKSIKNPAFKFSLYEFMQIYFMTGFVGKGDGFVYSMLQMVLVLL